MPLSKLFAGYRDHILKFVRDPQSSCLLLECIPEAEAFAAKLIASIEQEPASDEIVLAYSGPFVDPASYYTAAASAAVANVAEHRHELQAQQIELEFPDGLDGACAASVSSELLFADFAERCGRALSRNVARRTVFVLHADHPDALPGFVASARQLASLASTERTKFILFAGAKADVPVQVPAPQRLNIVEPTSRDERQQALAHLLSGDSRRVLLMHEKRAKNELLARDIEAVIGRASYYSKARYLTVRPGAIASMSVAVADQLCEQAAEQGVSLEPLDPTLVPVDAFADLCERWARTQVDPRGKCVVAIELRDFHDVHAELGRDFVMRLNRAACSVRVRYVVVERTEQGILPVLYEAARSVSSLRVSLDEQTLQTGLRSRLEDVAITPVERVQCLGSLAAIASAHRQHDEALALHDQALGWAEQIDDPATSCLVWLGIGQSLYRANAWSASADAHRKSLSIALDANNVGGIANASLSLADSLLCAEQYTDALVCYRSAADWYEKLGAPLFACHALTWLGETQRRALDPAAAMHTWVATLQRYDQLGPDFRGATLEGKKQVLQRLVRLYETHRDSRGAASHKHALAQLGEAPALSERP